MTRNALGGGIRSSDLLLPSTRSSRGSRVNKTEQAKRDREKALQEARAKGDTFTVSMLEANLVDFDPQPVYVPEICPHCHHEKAAMVGCYCVWGDGE